MGREMEKKTELWKRNHDFDATKHHLLLFLDDAMLESKDELVTLIKALQRGFVIWISFRSFEYNKVFKDKAKFLLEDKSIHPFDVEDYIQSGADPYIGYFRNNDQYIDVNSDERRKPVQYMVGNFNPLLVALNLGFIVCWPRPLWFARYDSEPNIYLTITEQGRPGFSSMAWYMPVLDVNTGRKITSDARDEATQILAATAMLKECFPRAFDHRHELGFFMITKDNCFIVVNSDFIQVMQKSARISRPPSAVEYLKLMAPKWGVVFVEDVKVGKLPDPLKLAIKGPNHWTMVFVVKNVGAEQEVRDAIHSIHEYYYAPGRKRPFRTALITDFTHWLLIKIHTGEIVDHLAVKGEDLTSIEFPLASFLTGGFSSEEEAAERASLGMFAALEAGCQSRYDESRTQEMLKKIIDSCGRMEKGIETLKQQTAELKTLHAQFKSDFDKRAEAYELLQKSQRELTEKIESMRKVDDRRAKELEGKLAELNRNVETLDKKFDEEAERMAEKISALIDSSKSQHESLDSKLDLVYEKLIASLPSVKGYQEGMIDVVKREWKRFRTGECSFGDMVKKGLMAAGKTVGKFAINKVIEIVSFGLITNVVD
jgi:hypothetical protein